MNEEILISIGLSITFTDREVNPERFLPAENSSMKTVFDLEPTVFPVPNEAEFDDLDVVQLQSSSKYSGKISRLVATLQYSARGHEVFDDVREDFKTKALIFFERFTESSVKIKGVSITVHNFYVSNNAVSAISGLISDTITAINTEEEIVGSTVQLVSKLSADAVDIHNALTIRNTTGRIAGNGETEVLEGLRVHREIKTDVTKDYSDSINADFFDSFVDRSYESLKFTAVAEALWPTRAS